MRRAGPVVLVAAVFTTGWVLGRNTVKAKRGDVAREFGYRRYHA
jgi:hypothetical protein